MKPEALLDWYEATARPLPWRTEVSAYRTLVSELMCQQTRIDTVLPYFERFMKAFPDEAALAAAPEERVLELWSGLGYYSRARNLQRAAQAVVASGGFPRSVEGLRELPGVGPYTAGAIASIVFGVDTPVVDGNVERVLARWYGEERPAKAWLWQKAAELLSVGRAGAFNQGLMELGALVCTPKSPRCAACPVAEGCAGRGEPQRFPAPKARKVVPRKRAVAAWLVRDGRVLLVRRPEGGLLGGLWELPGGEGTSIAELTTHLHERVGIDLIEAHAAGEVAHTFTHLHLDTMVFVASGGGGFVEGPERRWVPLEEVDGMALSTLARKTLRIAEAAATLAG